MRNELIEEVKNELFHSTIKLTRKIKAKRAAFLSKFPLFEVIHQKKGEQNFSLIVEHIRLDKFDYGETIFEDQEQRVFSYILKGSVLLYGHENHEQGRPTLTVIKNVGPKEHFGEKTNYNGKVLKCAIAGSPTYLLQIDLPIFYSTFSGHFQFNQLRDRIVFLQMIWAFTHLRRSVLERVLLVSQLKKFARGHVLFREGDQPEHAFVVLSGEVTLFTMCSKELIKFKQICILSKSEVCGFDQILGNTQFDNSGVCSTQFTEILLIEKKLLLEIMDGEGGGLIHTRKSINSQLKNSKLELVYREEENPQAPRRLKTEPTYEVPKLDRRQSLKNQKMREFKLKEIREQDRLKYKGNLATIANHSFTRDKNILLQYLIKKEAKIQEAIRHETEYQQTPVPLLRELSVEKSTAVRNHKRKLKKSRRSYYSQLRQQAVEKQNH